jgi:hypothetical protein
MEKKKVLKVLESLSRFDGAGRYGFHMMATKAYHQLGDISRNEPDLCYVYGEAGENKEYLVGQWVTGFGFFGVLYPVESTRELTEEEIKKYEDTYIQLADYTPHKIKIAKKGDVKRNW